MVPSSPTALLSQDDMTTRETLRHIRMAGFTHVDFNFCDLQHAHLMLPFVGDDWHTWAKDIVGYADTLGLTMSQAHGPVLVEGYSQQYWSMLRHRAFTICEMAHIPGMVFHPIGGRDTNRHEFIERNLDYYESLRVQGHEHGVELLLENMGHGHQKTAEDLLQYIHTLGSGVAVCWDTGHALIGEQNQPDSFLKLGTHLHGLHVQDGNGLQDSHTSPFFGIINWPEIIGGLRTAGYRGDLTFEVFNYHRRLPKELLDDGLRLLFAIANYLLCM